MSKRDADGVPVNFLWGKPARRLRLPVTLPATFDPASPSGIVKEMVDHGWVEDLPRLRSINPLRAAARQMANIAIVHSSLQRRCGHCGTYPDGAYERARIKDEFIDIPALVRDACSSRDVRAALFMATPCCEKCHYKLVMPEKIKIVYPVLVAWFGVELAHEFGPYL